MLKDSSGDGAGNGDREVSAFVELIRRVAENSAKASVPLREFRMEVMDGSTLSAVGLCLEALRSTRILYKLPACPVADRRGGLRIPPPPARMTTQAARHNSPLSGYPNSGNASSTSQS